MFGRSLRTLGLYREAEQALRHAEGMAGDRRPQVLAELGMVFHAAGEHASAEACFAEAVRESSIPGWVWIIRGANLSDANQFDAALGCYRHALTLADVDHDEAWLNIGYVLRAQGRYAVACDAFDKALELTPGYPEAADALEGLEGVADAMRLAQPPGASEP